MVARINRQLAAERIGRARRTLANRGGVGEREKAARKQPTVLLMPFHKGSSAALPRLSWPVKMRSTWTRRSLRPASFRSTA
jgi:hypothetical protein